MTKHRKRRDESPKEHDESRLRSKIANSFWQYRGLEDSIDLKTVIEADVSKQNSGYGPRPYYFDIPGHCADCNAPFVFRAKTQKTWFEDYGFFVDSRQIRCEDCLKERRKNVELKKQYDPYARVDDGELSPEEAQKVLGLMLELFEEPWSESMRNRMNRLSRIAATSETRESS